MDEHKRESIVRLEDLVIGRLLLLLKKGRRMSDGGLTILYHTNKLQISCSLETEREAFEKVHK